MLGAARHAMADHEVAPPPGRLADRVQLRSAFSTERGAVVRFVVQLEYWLDGDWRVVVRYDHDREAAGRHDVREEGLHRDIYRDGEKFRVESVSPPIPADEELADGTASAGNREDGTTAAESRDDDGNR